MNLYDQRRPLFPLTTALADDGQSLTVGGCRIADLAAAYGTPLYLFDEATLDASVNEYRTALAAYPAQSQITLAGKALLLTASAQWAAQQGLWLDCTGAGEIHIALHAGFPAERILVHGVNKSDEDIDAAVRHAAVIVVDNLGELHKVLQRLAAHDRAEPPALWLRVRPGVSVDTHAYRQTGQEESKFGMGLDEVARAVVECRTAGARLEGVHFHQGSHFHDVAPIGPGLERVLSLVAEVRAELGWAPAVLSPGGGWGVPYHEDDLPHPTIGDYVSFVAEHLQQECAQRELPLPRLHVEPGRSLVARAGVAVYRVGGMKQSGARNWLLVDGGMADNPRPALYAARYSALPVSAPARRAEAPLWIAGPYCESGDVLIQNLPMPEMHEGDLIAVPVSGAYHINMQSNYNGARRPAVLWLRDGQAHLVQRRERVEDLVARDLPLPAPREEQR